MSPGSRAGWMAFAAVCHFEEGDSDYGKPVSSANAADGRTQWSADGIQFGFCVYEGMRVYLAEGRYLIFRARDHHERLARSCAVLDMPCPSYETFVEAIELVVNENHHRSATRLYLRPLVFSAAGGIMPQQYGSYVFAVLGTNSAPEAGELRVLVEAEQPRTVPAFSAVKTATNYTSSALVTRRARGLGYDTVLWLGDGGKLQECTTMNVFLCVKGQVSTPALGGILPGITRRTMIELLAEQGSHVVERDLHITELIDAMDGDDLPCVFTTSTALGISKVTHLRYGDAEYELNPILPEPINVSKERYRALTERFPTEMARRHGVIDASYVGALRTPTEEVDS